MVTLHVLIGENAARKPWEDALRRGRPIEWVVPKKAEPGDTALFVFNHDQLIGTGVVASEPEPGAFGNQPAFRAAVGDLRMFGRPLPVDEVARRIPQWKWPHSFTKGRTTPAEDVARMLNRIVAEHEANVGFTGGPGGGVPAKVARKKVPSAPKNSAEPKDVKLSGPQLDAAIREQTSGAQLSVEGKKFLRTHVVTERKASNRRYVLELRADQGALSCDACGVELARRYGPQYAAVLELHHRVPLSRGAQHPKGTEVFALLCPTCHRVVHYRREEPLDVGVLRAQLRG